jgi:hypothetical protein
MRTAVTALMLLLPTGLFAQSDHLSMQGQPICSLAVPSLFGSPVDSTGDRDWANNYGGSCMFGADWTNEASQIQAWNWLDSMNLHSSDQQSVFVITSNDRNWTNNFGAGYPDLTSVASVLWSSYVNALAGFTSTTGQGGSPQ